MTETAERIRECVLADPGVHFRELVRRLDLGHGQAQYHLRDLTGRGTVVGERLYGQTHYYPPEFDPWERRLLALLHRETAGDVVAHLLSTGSQSPADVAVELDIARSTLEWHLERLVDAGVVEKQRGEGNRMRLHLVRPRDTLTVLQKADPSLTYRLVGRFTRLVDRLLSGEE